MSSIDAAVLPSRPTSREGATTTAVLADVRWLGLYRVAGLGAIATGILIPLQVVALIVWGLPDGVVAWFARFNESPFIGLVSFDLALMVEEALLVPIILALYVLLRRESESLMLVATGLWLVSVALFIGANTGFEMLSLSHGYAAAGSEAERAQYLAAGQTMLAAYMGQGSSFVMGYLLASAAGVLAGIAMLRNRVFSRVAAWAVIVANVVGLGLFIPVIGVPLSILSVVILIVWYLLIGWRLVRLPTGSTLEG